MQSYKGILLAQDQDAMEWMYSVQVTIGLDGLEQGKVRRDTALGVVCVFGARNLKMRKGIR